MEITWTTDWLKKNCNLIHYFGLGFIQIKLDQSNRVHFYVKDLPRTTNEEEVHDHRYNFVSKIICGSLWQQIFEVTPDSNGNFFMVQENCLPKADREIPSESVLVSVKPVFEKTYTAGDSYFIDHNTFHRVDSSDAVTHVCRGGYRKELANVVFSQQHELACPFSVKASEDVLWQMVDSRLKLNFPHLNEGNWS